MPGFYGQSAAVPLLLSVYSRLSGQQPLPAQPNTVSEAEVCWPLGRKTSATLPEACLQHQSAWLLEGRDPPTLPDPMDWPLAAAPGCAHCRRQADADPLPRCGTIPL